jgi:hypothetical protein
MAKRFTDTGKWAKASFRRLTPEMKCVWLYLCDACDHAGIWDVDLDLLGFQLGHQFTAQEIVVGLGDRIQPLSPTKWFIPGFIEFQYGELNPENKVHRSVIHKLKVMKEGLPSPLEASKEKDQHQDKEKEKDQEKEKEEVAENELHPAMRTALVAAFGEPALIQHFPMAQAGWMSEPDWKKQRTTFAKYVRHWLQNAEKDAKNAARAGPKAEFDIAAIITERERATGAAGPK